jgi:Icc-related predicted phosphoesterase
MDWCKGLLLEEKFKHIVFIAGNHDFLFQDHPDIARAFYQNTPGLHYLENSGVSIGGVNFFGVPQQPWFYDWAFNVHRGTDAMRQVWAELPPNTDVLITHGPPRGYGDITREGSHVGCDDQLARIIEAKTKHVVCGHIHEGYGTYTVENSDCIIHNASTCTRKYNPTNPPLVFDI